MKVNVYKISFSGIAQNFMLTILNYLTRCFKTKAEPNITQSRIEEQRLKLKENNDGYLQCDMMVTYDVI